MLSPTRLFFICFLCLVFGCATSGTDSGYLSPAVDSLTVENAIKLADQKLRYAKARPEDQSSSDYLVTSQALLKAKLNGQAEQLLLYSAPNTSSSKEPHAQQWRTLLQAQSALQEHRCQAAGTLLKQISTRTLSRAYHGYWHSLMGQVYQCQGQLSKGLASELKALEHATSTPQLSDEQLMSLWTRFQALPYHLKAPSKNDSILTPWFALLKVIRHSHRFEEDLQAWKLRWPEHPLNRLIQVKPRAHSSPRQIAVLLPTEGPYEDAANSVRDGIVAAYFAAPDKPTLKFYDLSKKNVIRQYHQAINDGAEVVIGPLVKEDVYYLSRAKPKDFPVPVIALNRSSKVFPHERLYQFGLSPEDEIQALIDTLRSNRYHRIGVLYPSTDYGRRLFNSFTEQWKKDEEHLTAVAYDENSDQSSHVRQLLNIDASQDRSKRIRKLLLRKIHSEPRRRQDIEALVLIADEQKARQVRPLFDFYYAESLPVYAPSSIFSGAVNPKQDRDLNDITFCDMPGLLDKNHPSNTFIKGLVNEQSSHSAEHLRLTALGKDAFDIALAIHRLEEYPKLGYPGTTGILSVDSLQRIIRQPIWAQFKNGVPELVNKS
jgi:hypothetical protein